MLISVFDTEMVVRGTPRAALVIGDTERHVDLSDNYYDDDQGFYWLHFGYRVQRGDHDADGEIIVPANGIDLNGGSITAVGVDPRPADLSYRTRYFCSRSTDRSMAWDSPLTRSAGSRQHRHHSLSDRWRRPWGHCGVREPNEHETAALRGDLLHHLA